MADRWQSIVQDPGRQAQDPEPEKIDRAWSSATGQKKLAQASRRRNNDKRVIENPLAQYSDEELVADVYQFHAQHLRSVDVNKLIKAARVAKDIRTYDEVARSDDPDAGRGLPVQLGIEERRALKRERDVAISERGMYLVILTVSLAAFLQGHVQSSINGASIFRSALGLGEDSGSSPTNVTGVTLDDWRLGAANASPFLFAAAVGCPLSLPINDLVGRRGAMVIAAMLILGSSLGAAFCRNWYSLFAVRIVNGIGMGIKAVSTPILASETAVGYWRGTSILAWQLWVAFGIMMGFVFNLIFLKAATEDTAIGLILGAPCVPAIILLGALWFCPESPRYYMRRRSANYSPEKAYSILLRLRNTQLQALRDLYLVHKSLEVEDYAPPDGLDGPHIPSALGRIKEYFVMYKQLLQERRLRNALVSSSTVAIAQQLCGINVMAFYSGNLFLNGGTSKLLAMEYSFGFGAVNFFFGLPAIRTIDTLGRRKWLTMTLPVMGLLMMAAVLSFEIQDQKVKIGIVAMFLFLFSAAYSPGMGPIPFTLASESFPLSHREAGCAFAVSMNLLFAGILSVTFPRIISTMHNSGTLGLFAGLNIFSFVLVFLFVEETKRRSLEDLDLVFAVPKRAFVHFQLFTYLPWFCRHYFGWLLCCLRNRRPADADEIKPNLYIDTVWGPNVDGIVEVVGDDMGGHYGNDYDYSTAYNHPSGFLPGGALGSFGQNGMPYSMAPVAPGSSGAVEPSIPPPAAFQSMARGDDREGPLDRNPAYLRRHDESDGASSIHD